MTRHIDPDVHDALLGAMSATIMELRAEIERLQRHIKASKDVVKSMADEIAKLVRERDHHETFAKIHEVEVPNEDEVVSYDQSESWKVHLSVKE